MVLPDNVLRRLGIFAPYSRGKKRPGKVSFGESSAGYDIRAGDEWKIFTNTCATLIDPKNFKPDSFVHHKGPFCIIPPNSFALAYSIEYVKMPRDCIGIVLGKSTYARCGICANFTPLEPEWEGQITVEIANTTPLPAKVYSNEGIAQVLILRLESQCDTSYKDKGGRYQGQKGITLPKVEAASGKKPNSRKKKAEAA
jgi:dCTP deaminase